MNRSLTALGCVALTGCGFAAGLSRIQPCNADSDCAGGEVCFADGLCGNPGQGIFVEVTASANSGLEAQDFAVQLEGQQSIQLSAPLLIYGALKQGSVPNSMLDGGSSGYPAYTQPVSVQATGVSLLIPGRARSYQTAQGIGSQAGLFELNVGSGTYDLTVTSSESWLPPWIAHGIELSPGSAALQETVIFPVYGDPASIVTVKGNLSLTGDAGYSVQAFDPGSGDPLSQATHVTSATGDFQMFIDSRVLGLSDFIVVGTPTTDSVYAPQKSFTVSASTLQPSDAGSPVLALAVGNYGQPTPVAGRLLDGMGNAVPNADVHIEGQVQGGGNYVSPHVTSGADGKFSLQSLPTATDGSAPLILWALPPSGVRAGSFSQPITVTPAGGNLGILTCPDRIQVKSTVALPDGTPAVGATVSAVLVKAPLNNQLSSAPAVATADSSGTFSLWLDPAFYRFDFAAQDTSLPTTSRFVDETTAFDVPLSKTLMQKGSQLNGAVAKPGQAGPAANAAVRFFKTGTLGMGAAQVSYQIAQTVTDVNGNYTVVVPTR